VMLALLVLNLYKSFRRQRQEEEKIARPAVIDTTAEIKKDE